jgi:hypothetical protein
MSKTVDADELLKLLDHVDVLVRFCCCHMPDIQKYARGSKAMWAVAHRLAGNDEVADRLVREIGLLADAKE